MERRGQRYDADSDIAVQGSDHIRILCVLSGDIPKDELGLCLLKHKSVFSFQKGGSFNETADTEGDEEFPAPAPSPPGDMLKVEEELMK